MHSNRSRWLFAIPAGASLGAWAEPLTRPGLVAQDTINTADTTWLMTATALVLLMTLPGIALFYGGMVRKKSVINTMASVVAVAAMISILWFAAGYSLAFTPGNAWIGGTDRLWFSGLDYLKEAGKLSVSHIAPNVPESVYAMFQLTFATITGALLVGAFVERMRFSAMLWFIGMCSGLVAGLVAITPAAGYVTPAAALLFGAVAGVACYWGATGLKRLLNADDSLDVFGVHGIGGIVGSLMTGVFASKAVSGVSGSFLVQLVGVGAVVLYSTVASLVLLWITNGLVGLRVDEQSEITGLDVSEHREHLGT